MKNGQIDTSEYPNTLLVGIFTHLNLSKDPEGYFQEFVNLAESDGIQYVDKVFIKLRSIDPAYFITEGKLEELLEICKKYEIEELIISEQLSAQQERNLSAFLKCKVFDRTQLILEIFEKGAGSTESKLQVELAMLHNKKSRLAGRGIHMSQQGGKIGTRGPGETAKEKETQHIERRVSKIKRDLKELSQHKQTQRKQRSQNDIPQICLIGYTNAGKSTILNLLTKSDVLAKDQLFATLDTTTRELYINKRKIGVLSDTVGFIQNLPHHLIEAFKSTLSELQHADLLLQVIDANDNNFENHIKVVFDVLKELEVDKPMLFVFNKIDKVQNLEKFKKLTEKYQPQVSISALSKETILPLIEFIDNWKK